MAWANCSAAATSASVTLCRLVLIFWAQVRLGFASGWGPGWQAGGRDRVGRRRERHRRPPRDSGAWSPEQPVRDGHAGGWRIDLRTHQRSVPARRHSRDHASLAQHSGWHRKKPKSVSGTPSLKSRRAARGKLSIHADSMMSRRSVGEATRPPRRAEGPVVVHEMPRRLRVKMPLCSGPISTPKASPTLCWNCRRPVGSHQHRRGVRHHRV